MIASPDPIAAVERQRVAEAVALLAPRGTTAAATPARRLFMTDKQGYFVLLARLLLMVMFLHEGIAKFGDLVGTAGYIASAGLPMPKLLAVGSGALELVASALLIVGWQARWAALALAGFTLLANLLFHNYWTLPADQQMVAQLFFLKNLAVMGGLLMVFAFGPGSISLDQRRAAA
jgi:putative oxidoreductase